MIVKFNAQCIGNFNCFPDSETVPVQLCIQVLRRLPGTASQLRDAYVHLFTSFPDFACQASFFFYYSNHSWLVKKKLNYLA